MDNVESRLASRRQKLDLSRRKIAAISFLSNIQVEGETERPGYKCLEGTAVLKSYQKYSHRRKLFRKKGVISIELAPEKRSVVKKTSQCGGLSLDGERREKSPLPYLYAKAYKTPQHGEDKTFRRRLNYTSQWSEDCAIEMKLLRERKDGSTESLQHGIPHEAVFSFHQKVRKLSGNLSENSYNSSAKEVKFVKNAEENQSLGDERLVLVTARYVPFAIFSTIPYHKAQHPPRAARRVSMNRMSFSRTDYKHDTSKRLRHSSGGRPLPAINDTFDPFEMLGLERSEIGQEISYSCLLEPSYRSAEPQLPIDQIHSTHETGRNSPKSSQFIKAKLGRVSPKSGRVSPAVYEAGSWGVPLATPYSPHTLDGWLGAGRHRTVLPFSSYITSVIEYVKPADLKKELNEKFKDKFPAVNLTLSKLRSLKLEMRRIGLECEVDMVSIAQAYVYFEKLVLKNIINKSNRKFCAGACLILAAKLNDFKGESLKLLIEKTETIFRLNRRDLLSSEFAVFVGLEFSLHVPTAEIYPHFQRLIYQT